jgi:hypothetical protein
LNLDRQQLRLARIIGLGAAVQAVPTEEMCRASHEHPACGSLEFWRIQNAEMFVTHEYQT